MTINHSQKQQTRLHIHWSTIDNPVPTLWCRLNRLKVWVNWDGSEA